MQKLVLVVLFGILAALGTTVVVYAAGPFPGAKSEPVEFRMDEPIGVELFISSKGESDAGYKLDPGEELILGWRITNSSSSVDYVVEIVPVSNDGGPLDFDFWELHAVGRGYEFEGNLNGPAHLLVQAGGAYHITLTIAPPHDAPAPLFSSFQFDVRRTDCTEVPSCPWG